MREPTENEMIAGIAKGFSDFLKDAHPFSKLCPSNIRDAIESGVKKSMDGRSLNSIPISTAEFSTLSDSQQGFLDSLEFDSSTGTP